LLKGRRNGLIAGPGAVAHLLTHVRKGKQEICFATRTCDARLRGRDPRQPRQGTSDHADNHREEDERNPLKLGCWPALDRPIVSNPKSVETSGHTTYLDPA
jgi:hypothetical protein